MKNFLEALDTDKEIEIVVKLTAISHNGYPDINLSVCEHVLYDGPLSKSKSFQINKGINDLLTFQITLKNKKYSPLKETACLIDEISIDGYEILPKYQHFSTYENDHGKNISTNYVGYNGTWTLKFDRPFYQWHHQISGQGMLIKP